MPVFRRAFGIATPMLWISLAIAAQADQPTVEGVWQQIDNGTGYVGGLISFKENGGLWEGYIVKMYPKPGDPVDPSCTACTDDRKDHPVLGLRLIQNAKRSGLSYEGGTILDPRNGSQYSVQLTLSPDNRTLTVRGYLGLTLFGQSQTWKRLTESDPDYPKPTQKQQTHTTPKKDHSSPKPDKGRGEGE
jgi:uncharacterized protein (DUF2147 family)